MKLRIALCSLLLGILITACGGSGTPTGEAVTTTDVGQQIPAADTAAPTMSVPGDLQLTTNCTVVSTRPTPGPTQESLFPPVSEEDWIMGAEEAEVTFLEYSDFQ